MLLMAAYIWIMAFIGLSCRFFDGMTSIFWSTTFMFLTLTAHCSMAITIMLAWHLCTWIFEVSVSCCPNGLSYVSYDLMMYPHFVWFRGFLVSYHDCNLGFCFFGIYPSHLSLSGTINCLCFCGIAKLA